jgi:hypothetical protein
MISTMPGALQKPSSRQEMALIQRNLDFRGVAIENEDEQTTVGPDDAHLS